MRQMGERLKQEEIKDINNNITNGNNNDNDDDNKNNNNNNYYYYYNNKYYNGIFHSFEKALFKRLISYDMETLVKKND